MPVAMVSFLFSADRQFDRQTKQKKVMKTSNDVKRKVGRENELQNSFPSVVLVLTAL